MRPNRVPLLLGAFALTSVAQPVVLAQSTPVLDCDSAAKIVAKGRLSREEQEAFRPLSVCGVRGARALAAGLQHFTTETDIDALDDFMHEVDNWRDASIFDAVRRLVMNPAASAQARVFGVRYLILLLRPHFMLSYAGLSTRGVDTTVRPNGLDEWTQWGCSPDAMISARRTSRDGEPLPPDYEDRVRTTLSALATSGSIPAPVRNAARCGLELVPP